MPTPMWPHAPLPTSLIRKLTLALLFVPLAACDQLSERLGMPDPTKIRAEGEAVGGACRHAGRGLEDCFKLNPRADKAAVYAGWKEMNEYMTKNNMQAVPPSLDLEPVAKKPGKKSDAGDNEAEDAGSPGHGEETKDKTATKDGGEEAKGGH